MATAENLTKRRDSGKAQAARARRPYRHPVTGSTTYQRCPLSPAEVEELRAEICCGRGNAALANREAERVAHNVAAALSDEARPGVVRAAVAEYTAGLLAHLGVGADFESDPELAFALLPAALRRVSRVPFVPDRAHIEALTGDDTAAARRAAAAGPAR